MLWVYGMLWYFHLDRQYAHILGLCRCLHWLSLSRVVLSKSRETGSQIICLYVRSDAYLKRLAKSSPVFVSCSLDILGVIQLVSSCRDAVSLYRRNVEVIILNAAHVLRYHSPFYVYYR